MDKKIVIKTLGGIAIGGVVAYILFNVFKKRPQTFGQLATDVKDTVVKAPSDLVRIATNKYNECGFPLKKGCGGENVKKLQAFLNREGSYGLVVDGKFGELTENAVIDQQTPFEAFKLMHPEAKKGEISEQYFRDFISK